jgi:hypothetical protein
VAADQLNDTGIDAESAERIAGRNSARLFKLRPTYPE